MPQTAIFIGRQYGGPPVVGKIVRNDGLTCTLNPDKSCAGFLPEWIFFDDGEAG
ncbi:MAG: hypothetical protein KIS67_04845 [Verrucomicrobiae bacterium]|nr:hypothetical protein [Verrucomicrobiae bacterium]